MARETMAEIRAGRPVQPFLTDFPRIVVNHSVLAFDYHAIGAETVDFVVYVSERSGGARGHSLRPARRALPLRSTLGGDGAVRPSVPSVLLPDLLGAEAG